MKTLLRIDSSPLASGTSFSRQLTAEFVRKWQLTNPDGKVITRDLSTTNLTPINAEWIAAAYTPEASLTESQRQELSISNELIAELKEADEYAIGVAMHNFSIPSVLKLWIDQMVRAGKTFTYESGKGVGLLSGKKAVFLVSSGGVYEQGTPAAAMNFVEPYLQSIFGFLGVTDTSFINAGGTAQVRNGVAPAAILQPAFGSIHARFQTA